MTEGWGGTERTAGRVQNIKGMQVLLTTLWTPSGSPPQATEDTSPPDPATGIQAPPIYPENYWNKKI